MTKKISVKKRCEYEDTHVVIVRAAHWRSSAPRIPASRGTIAAYKRIRRGCRDQSEDSSEPREVVKARKETRDFLILGLKERISNESTEVSIA